MIVYQQHLFDDWEDAHAYFVKVGDVVRYRWLGTANWEGVVTGLRANEDELTDPIVIGRRGRDGNGPDFAILRSQIIAIV